MSHLFTRARQKKKRSASSNDVRNDRAPSLYIGPRRRSSQETLVVNRYDPTQEHYGQLATNLSAVNRTLNHVVRDIMNADNASPSIGPAQRYRVYDYDSDDTAASVDSLQISGCHIFGRSINAYNAKRSMPIVSLALRTGQLVFSSPQALDHFKKSHKWRLTGAVDRRTSSTSSSVAQRPSRELWANDGVAAAAAGSATAATATAATAAAAEADSTAIADDDDDGTAPQYEEDSDLALFQVSIPPLSQFRKKCPYMVISKYYLESELRLREHHAAGVQPDAEESVKYPFCKVYDKYLKCGVKRFVLEFYPNPDNASETFRVVMFTHRSKPYTDSIYKGTKLRFVGTSVCTSVFGSSLIQLMVMNEPDALSLADGMTADEKPAPGNPLLKEETTLNDLAGGAINYKLYGNSTLPPLAKLTDAGADMFPRKFNKLGLIYCYEAINLQNRDEVYGDYNNVKAVKLDTMVITCMLLVLREQESKKNPRGTTAAFTRSTSYYGAGASHGAYGSYDTSFPLGNMW